MKILEIVSFILTVVLMYRLLVGLELKAVLESLIKELLLIC